MAKLGNVDIVYISEPGSFQFKQKLEVINKNNLVWGSLISEAFPAITGV